MRCNIIMDAFEALAQWFTGYTGVVSGDPVLVGLCGERRLRAQKCSPYNILGTINFKLSKI